jgi:RNA polymerase sigma-70 factor (ECF subfamily)
MMDLDAELRELVAAGKDDAAATRAIEALGSAVLGYLRALLPDDDDAEDVVQLWAEDVWRGLPGFRWECPVRAWSYRLALSAASRFQREAWRRRRDRLPTSAASRLAASMVRSAALPGRDERLELLCKDLDAEERTLLHLRLVRELSWDEIAAVLAGEGTPVATAALRKRFQRLKDRMGQLARENGLL